MKTLRQQSLRTALFARIKGDQSVLKATPKSEETLTVLDSEVIWQAVMQSRDAIAIADASVADHPLILVNPAFEKLTGYPCGEVRGRNCRFLQGADRQQRNINLVRHALQKGEYSTVTLRNYRKDGTMFWNELSISPIFGQDRRLTHFIGIQKDVSARVILDQRSLKQRRALELANATLENMVIHDTLTGIYSRKYFEDRLQERWQQLLGTRENLVVMFIDVDDFKQFNDTYGHIAGDVALKKIAAVLEKSLRRTSELVARFGGEEFIALASQMTHTQAIAQARTMCRQVRNLAIPHEHSRHMFLTISCGVATVKPGADETPSVCLRYADHALYQAKERGKNQAVMFGE